MISCMTPLECLSRESDSDVKVSSSEILAPLASVSGSRNKNNIESAELPFLEVDIREIFAIPCKPDFRPRKRRKRFCRRNQFWKKSCCLKPKTMLCEGKDPSAKLRKQQPDEGKKEMEEVQQVKVKSTSHVAVQTEQGQPKGRKAQFVMVQVQQQPHVRDNAPSLTVTIQQQWDGEGDVPEVTVEVQNQEQKTDMPCITIQVQQEWNNPTEVSCVSVKVQQQKAGRETPCPCVTVQVQQKNREEEIPHESAHWQPTSRYEAASCVIEDQQQAQYKEKTILDKIEDVQELIFTKEPDLLKALVPVQTMHLTIIMAHLSTEDDVRRAVSALEHSKAKVKAMLQEKLFSMTFHGIGQFNNQVIYVKMSEDEQQMLSRIAEAVWSSFTEMNVDISGSKAFKPHLTFLKLSKAPALRRKGFRKIHEDLYTEYEDSLFGTEILSQIDLCAMHKKKQDSGYYHCECSINVHPTNYQNNKKEEMHTDDPKENIPDDLLNDGTFDNARPMPADNYLASPNNYKLTENVDGNSVTTLNEGNDMNKRERQARAKDETFTADGEVCSKLLPELLPASPETLKAKHEEQEEAKLTDGDLGKVEQREKASQQPANNV
ncbi:uncharacterized protein LOC128323107 isoform X2 [Hemicordylus capensis]|uniref:uncharacterized protein LOC128323107 isoform X2 n=1 Tax=Hemicordylus capensis TaxID=884348 RepID=UPI00230276F5|nr:uncharacterized protein LOC128323107 isoform X2 [Hemicordylus capensis]